MPAAALRDSDRAQPRSSIACGSGVVCALWLAIAAGCAPALEGAPCTADRHCPDSQTCVEGACRARCTLGCSDGLRCGFRSGAPACECPPPEDTALLVDAAAGTAIGDAPFPTGAASPAQCRFRTVSDALAVAREVTATGGTAEVKLHADPAGPVRYAQEPLPWVIPAGVSVAPEVNPGDPTQHLLVQVGNGDAIRLEGGSLSGVTLLNESALAPVNGILVACENATAKLEDVVVDAAASGSATPLLRGIEVQGCALTADRVTVRGARTGLRVNGSPGVQWQGGVLKENGTGIEHAAGALAVTGTKLQGNAIGLEHVDGALAITGGEISGSTDVGLKLGSSASGTVTLSGTTLSRNGHSALSLAGPGAQTTLTDVAISEGEQGISVLAGTLELQRVGVTGATGAATSSALLVTGGATSGNAFTATGNDTGIRALGGTVALQACGIAQSSVRGVAVDQASANVTLTGCTLESNGGFGAQVTAGKLALHGGTVRSGGGIGLEVTSGGALELLGTQAEPLVIENHPNNGLNVADGSVTAQWVSFRANKELRIEQTDGQPHTLSFQDCAFSAVETEPAVFRAVQTGPLTIERSTFTGGQVGLVAGPATVELHLRQSLVSGAAKAGVQLRGGSTSTFELTGNELIGTTGAVNSTAGLLLTDGSGTVTWSANRIHGNSRHQLSVSAGDWVMSGGTCTAPNELTCYAPSPGRGVFAATGATVKVGSVAWQNSAPLLNTDFESTNVTVGTPCAKSAISCP